MEVKIKISPSEKEFNNFIKFLEDHIFEIYEHYQAGNGQVEKKSLRKLFTLGGLANYTITNYELAPNLIIDADIGPYENKIYINGKRLGKGL